MTGAALSWKSLVLLDLWEGKALAKQHRGHRFPNSDVPLATNSPAANPTAEPQPRGQLRVLGVMPGWLCQAARGSHQTMGTMEGRAPRLPLTHRCVQHRCCILQVAGAKPSSPRPHSTGPALTAARLPYGVRRWSQTSHVPQVTMEWGAGCHPPAPNFTPKVIPQYQKHQQK